MTTENLKLSFLLDLFHNGHENMYMSNMELMTKNDQPLNRMEIILPNVGRLCLYQRFIETPDGEQIPDFHIFYTSVINPNVRTKIQSQELLKKAIHIMYDCKKYCEQHPEYKLGQFKNFIINKMMFNEKLAQKLYNKQINKYRHNLILSNMNHK